MTEKIHRVLDGELPAAALNPRETDVLLATANAVTAAVREIPDTAGVDLAPAVLARIRPAQTREQRSTPSRWPSALDWLWSTRSLSLQWRPAYAFGLVAAMVLAVAVTTSRNPTATSPRTVFVQFRLDAPGASQVQLAGNFTSWKANVSLKRSAAGVWTVVLPLTPGVHNYAFVVDGNHWVPDPTAQPVSDGFGGTNSQLAVLTPDNAAAL